MNTAQWIFAVGFALQIVCCAKMVRARSTASATSWAAGLVSVALGTALLGAMFLGA